jgi:hypothetical protein
LRNINGHQLGRVPETLLGSEEGGTILEELREFKRARGEVLIFDGECQS